MDDEAATNRGRRCSVRVLFVTSAYPASSDDPRGVFVHRLARGLSARGVDIVVVAPGFPGGTSRHTLDGVDVRRASYWIPRWQRLASGLGGIVPNIKERPWLAAQVLPLVAALVSQTLRITPGVDVIHAHWLYPGGLAGLAARRRYRKPLVVTSHGGDLNLARQRGILRRISGRVARTADACVAVSRSLVDEFVSLGVPGERIEFIPYGVTMENGEHRTTVGGGGRLDDFRSFDGFRILYLGSLIPRKSVETLLAAHRELRTRGRNVGTMIVGAGPTLERLQAVVRDGSIECVWFAPTQPPSSVISWMRAADVLALPSLSEGRPNVVLEALATGLPVVASDIPGTRELVEHGKTGFLFPAGSAPALADRLEELLSNQPRRVEMGRKAGEWVVDQGLTTSHIAAKHLALYERLATGNQ